MKMTTRMISEKTGFAWQTVKDNLKLLNKYVKSKKVKNKIYWWLG